MGNGQSVWASDQYLTYTEFTAFVSNAERYLEINTCVWSPGQRSTLLAFYRYLINRLENVAPVDPALPWGSPGGSWPSNTALADYVQRVIQAVPKSPQLAVAYPYTVNTFVAGGPLPTGLDTRRAMGALFTAVALFWGAFVDKDNAQTYLEQSDYSSYLYIDAAGTVDASAIRNLNSGLSRIHFVGREVTLRPNQLVILQDPVLLLSGRLVRYPQTRNDKCCEARFEGALLQVNCGVYITRSTVDTCTLGCVDPCSVCTRSFNSDSRSVDTQATSSQSLDGACEPSIFFRSTFTTLRPFFNSDQLVPELFNRVGRFFEQPWDLALPDEFLTSREITARNQRLRDNPDLLSGRTQFVPYGTAGTAGPIGPLGVSTGSCGSCDSKGSRDPRDPRDPREAKHWGQDSDKGPRTFRIETDVVDDRPHECGPRTFAYPQLSIPVEQVRYLRPRTVFGLLQYLIERVNLLVNRSQWA